MIDMATALWIAGLTLIVGAVGFALSGAVAVSISIGVLWTAVGVWADYRGGDS